jgi:hypothetical protein
VAGGVREGAPGAVLGALPSIVWSPRPVEGRSPQTTLDAPSQTPPVVAPWVRNHLSVGMRAIAVHHTKMARELTTL